MFNTLPKGQRWSFLWEMISRYFNYFDAIKYGSLRPVPSDFKLQDIDIVFSFFILCFHLKDWIKKDYPKIARKVEKFIANSRINECRAIANGVKHLNSAGPDFAGSRIKFIAREGDRLRMAVYFSINSDGKEEDAFALAKECMELWCKFIEDNIVGNAEAGAAVRLGRPPVSDAATTIREKRGSA